MKKLLMCVLGAGFFLGSVGVNSMCYANTGCSAIQDQYRCNNSITKYGKCTWSVNICKKA